MPRILIALCFVGVLAGCTVGPNYQRPELALTPGFHTPLPATTTGPPWPQDAASWWAGFNDPELCRVVERAGAQNLDLAQAAARLRQSRAMARAAGAAMAPVVDVNGSAAKVKQSLDGPIGMIGRRLPGFERDIDDYTSSVGASWEIDLFGGLRRQRQAARASASAVAADLAALKTAVQADAADAYLDIRAFQARLAVARRQEQVETELVALLNQRVGEGISPERDLHQAEALLEGVRATLVPLNTGLEAELNRLDVLMGAQPGAYRAELLVQSPIPPAPALTQTTTPADLLRRRPDVIAAEERLRAANARIGAAISNYYPKASLSALLGVDSLAASSIFHSDAQQSQFGVGLRWRLFDFGRIDADVAGARGADAEALGAYRLAVLRAAEEVEDSFTRLSDERRRASVLTRQIAALTIARRQAEDAYQGGVLSLVEVRDADRDLLAASDQRIQAEAGAARAAVASFRALGGGWTR